MQLTVIHHAHTRTKKKTGPDTVMYGISGDSDNQDNNYTNALAHPSSPLIT